MSITVDHKRAYLKHANEVRSAMSEIKLLVGVKALTLADALEDERAGAISSYDLLRALPRVGPHRAKRILMFACVPAEKRVRELTPRQRHALVAEHAR